MCWGRKGGLYDNDQERYNDVPDAKVKKERQSVPYKWVVVNGKL
jgi:hypothetical protein